MVAVVLLNAAAASDDLPVLPYQSEYNFQEKELESVIASFVYRGIDSPNRMRNQAVGAFMYYSFDLFGYGDELLGAAVLVKHYTRISFNECVQLKLKFDRLMVRNCLNNYMYMELNSEYDLDSVSLKVHWVFK